MGIIYNFGPRIIFCLAAVACQTCPHNTSKQLYLYINWDPNDAIIFNRQFILINSTEELIFNAENLCYSGFGISNSRWVSGYLRKNLLRMSKSFKNSDLSIWKSGGVHIVARASRGFSASCRILPPPILANLTRLLFLEITRDQNFILQQHPQAEYGLL
jgi:hypothetical protein